MEEIQGYLEVYALNYIYDLETGSEIGPLQKLPTRNCTKEDFSKSKKTRDHWEVLMKNGYKPICLDSMEDIKFKNSGIMFSGGVLNLGLYKCAGEGCKNSTEVDDFINQMEVMVFGFFD